MVEIKIFNGCRDCKYSIASEAFCMNQVVFALQNTLVVFHLCIQQTYRG